MRTPCLVVFALFLGLIAVPAEASIQASAEAATADTVEVELPEVVVQATRTTQPYETLPFSYAVEVAPPEIIELTPRLSISAALEHLPGLQIDNRGHFALGERISIRGMGRRAPFGTRGVSVVLDGIPMTMPDGQAVLEAVEPSLIRRAELLRGPSSLFWGNASGGTLLLSTEAPVTEPRLHGRASLGSFNTQHIRLEAHAPIGRSSFQGYASHNSQEGYRDYSAGYRTRAGVHGRVPLADATTLRVTGAFVDQDTEHPGSLTREQVDENPDQARDLFAQAEAGKWSTQAQLGLTLRHELDIGTLTATGFGLMRSLDNPLPFAYIDLDRTAGGVRLGLENTRGLVHWNIGVDASGQWDDRKNFNTVDGQAGNDLRLDQLETVIDGAVFGSMRLPLTDRLHMQGGLRADAIRFEAEDRLPRTGDAQDDDQSGSRSFLAWSPAVGLTYELLQTRLYANYRTAFETPTTTELVNRPDMEGGFNPDLDPQRVQGLEAGWRGTAVPGLVDFDAAIYRLYVQDRLISFRTEDGGDRDFFRNAGLTTHDGIELTTNVTPADNLHLYLSYSGSYYVYREEEFEGNLVPGIPPHRFFATLRGMAGDLWGRARLELASSTYVNDENDEQSPGYTVLDLQAGYRSFDVADARAAPFLSINNVFNQRYISSVIVNDGGRRYYEPAQGRSITLGINVEI